MVDDVTTQVDQLSTIPAGTKIATDEIAGAHHQRVKIEFGASDTATQVSTSDPLPVTVLSTDLAGLLTQSDFDTKTGSLTETAPATDTASSGLNGRLQRLAQRITSMIALLPAALGAGGGLKVDGSGTALPVSGTVATTVADGSNAVEGVTTGAAVITDANGTIQQYLRGLVKQWAAGALGVVLTAETTKVIGTVRVASGGIASGSLASGSVASGAIASGAVASGAFAAGSIAAGAVAAGATSFVKLEDVASADADAGVPALAVRKATPANTSGTDGDYEFLQMSAGRLWASATIDAALPAGTNTIGKDYIAFQTTKALTNAALTLSSSGENTAVSGTAAQTIRVFKLVLVAASAVSVTLKDAAGGTSLTGAIPLTANGSLVLEAFDGEPLFVSASAGAFIVNLSSAVTVTGFIQYTKS